MIDKSRKTAIVFDQLIDDLNFKGLNYSLEDFDLKQSNDKVLFYVPAYLLKENLDNILNPDLRNMVELSNDNNNPFVFIGKLK